MRAGLRVPGVPYLQMLRQVSYRRFCLGVSTTVDHSGHLPRMEVLITGPTGEDRPFPAAAVDEHPLAASERRGRRGSP